MVVVAPVAIAQEREAEHIETDRDSFTPSTVTARRGRLVVESAYSFIDNRDVLETHSLPELLARYGVTDWLELRSAQATKLAASRIPFPAVAAAMAMATLTPPKSNPKPR